MAFVQKMEVKGKRYSVKWKKCGVNGLIGLSQNDNRINGWIFMRSY